MLDSSRAQPYSTSWRKRAFEIPYSSYSFPTSTFNPESKMNRMWHKLIAVVLLGAFAGLGQAQLPPMQPTPPGSLPNPDEPDLQGAACRQRQTPAARREI